MRFKCAKTGLPSSDVNGLVLQQHVSDTAEPSLTSGDSGLDFGPLQAATNASAITNFIARNVRYPIARHAEVNTPITAASQSVPATATARPTAIGASAALCCDRFGFQP